jgi:hypothetical protein
MIRKQSQVILFQFSPISYINKQHYHSEKIERFTKRLSEGQEYKKENIYVPRQQKFDIRNVKKILMMNNNMNQLGPNHGS